MAIVAGVSLLGAQRGLRPGAQRLDQGRYTVIHYADDAPLARAALAAAVARDSFPSLPRATTRIVIMIAPDAETFRAWAGRGSLPWAAAVAFVAQHRVVLQGRTANSDAGDHLQVLRHELAHIALFDYLGDAAPRWFDEGYASYAAGEERNDGFLATNAALLLRRLPSLAALDSMLASPHATEARAGYALSLRAVTDLAAIDRERGLTPLLIAWKERGSFDLALRRASAMTSEEFEHGWQRRTRWQFAFVALAGEFSLGGIGLVAILLPLYRSRRREQRDRLRVMHEREARAERARRSAALDYMLQASVPGDLPRIRDLPLEDA